MSSDEPSSGRSGGALAALLASLCAYPSGPLVALDELRPMRLDLTRVREHTEPLGDVLPALEHLEEVLGARLDAVYDVIVALESDESHLNRTSIELGGGVQATPTPQELPRRRAPAHQTGYATLMPSCITIPISSELPQRSLNLPSRNFTISTPRAEIRWPVGARP